MKIVNIFHCSIRRFGFFTLPIALILIASCQNSNNVKISSNNMENIHAIESMMEDAKSQNPNIYMEKLRKADNLLAGILKKNPNNDRAYLLLGELHLAEEIIAYDEILYEKHKARAEKYFHKAIEINPANAMAFHLLGQIHSAEPVSVEYFENAVKADPEFVEARVFLGMAYYKIDRSEDAMETLKKVLQMTKDNPGSWNHNQATYYIGRSYVQLKQFENGEKYLTRSADLSRKHNDTWGCPYRALGALYSGQGRHSKASKVFIDSAQRERDIGDTQFEAARELFEAGDFALAETYIDRALELANHSRYYVLKGFCLLLRREYEKAATQFDTAAKSKIHDPGVNIGRAHLHISRKEFTQAEKLLADTLLWDDAKFDRIAMELGWDQRYLRFLNNMSFVGMGWVLAYENKPKEAILHYERVLAHKPDDTFALLGKADSLLAQKDMNSARPLYEKVLKTDPENPYAMAGMGLIHLNQGDLNKAEKAFESAIDKSAHSFSCPYEGLGLVFLRQGEKEKARKNFEKAITINPNSEFKKFNGLAKIYIEEGKFEQARNLLKKSIENFPQDPEAQELMAQIKGQR